MSYKYFGRLAGSTHTAIKALTESAPPNTLTPFNAQAPATKFLAYGEDATSLAFNRALGALSANTDYLAAILNNPSLQDELIIPRRVTPEVTGGEGSWTSGIHDLSPAGIDTTQTALHLDNTAGTEPAYWVHLGLHKHKLDEKVQFHRTQAQDWVSQGSSPLANTSSGYTDVVPGGYVGPQNSVLTDVVAPSTHHTALPIDAYANEADQNNAVSYFEPQYKGFGGQSYLGSSANGVAIHLPPIRRIKSPLYPYSGDWSSESIHKWDTDGVYLRLRTFSETALRPGCFVEISGDGDEHVNQKNNGLFQIAEVIGSESDAITGGTGDKAILTRGGLYRVTVRDWRMFGHGELVSWASPPNGRDQVEDTADKPGLRKNYAHVAYIIPRPDLGTHVGEQRGDLYLAMHRSLDDFPSSSYSGKVGKPENEANSRYNGRFRYGSIGSPDQEEGALQNHGLNPGTRLYHGHAHFYPDQSPWGLDAQWALPYSDILSPSDGVPNPIIGPGEPVSFATDTAPGKVWPCAPPGFALNPSFGFSSSNSLYAGEYVGHVKTLTTVKEALLANSATAGSGAQKGMEAPKDQLLDAWLRFIRHGHMAPSNARAGVSQGHDTENDMAGIRGPKVDDLNRFAAPTKQLLGSDLWDVEFIFSNGDAYATLEDAYKAYLTQGNVTGFVGDLHNHYMIFAHPYAPDRYAHGLITSISGNRATIAQVCWRPYGESSVTGGPLKDEHGHDGWDRSRKMWPITDVGTGSVIDFTTPGGGATYWRVSNIHKAPWLDDAYGRGRVATHGLNAAYHNDFSSSPYLRGDLDENHASGSGNDIWIMPGRPFTTVLPGDDNVAGAAIHVGTNFGIFHENTANEGRGQIAHLTKSNQSFYTVLHRLCYRGGPEILAGKTHTQIRAEISQRLGHSHGHKFAEISILENSYVGVWEASAAEKYTYSEIDIGGQESTQRLLFVDETTSTHGYTPELGDWGAVEARKLHSGDTPANWDDDHDYMAATNGKDGDPKHGVFLSNNLSKTTRDYRTGSLYDKPAFDSRSTPQEVQDRSILGAIEGTLLGNYTPFSGVDGNHAYEQNTGRKDIDSFGIVSNGVLKGGAAWFKKQENDDGYPSWTVGPGGVGPCDFWIGEAYFVVGGAKWYQPASWQMVGDSIGLDSPKRYLLVWSADYRRYVWHTINPETGKIEAQAINISGTTYHTNNGTGSMVGDFPAWDSPNEIPIAVIETAMEGAAIEIKSITDVRRRIQRLDQKTTLYVGQVYNDPYESTLTNHGYVDSSMHFRTLGEAFAAMSFWSLGHSQRSWSVEVVGPVEEMQGAVGDDWDATRGYTYPIKMPCDGITVRGLRGRTWKSVNDYNEGWALGQYNDALTPVVHWGREDLVYAGLFDMDGRHGITFENLSFRFEGKLDNQLPYATNPGGVNFNVEGDVEDCLFVALNEAYNSGKVVNNVNHVTTVDREGTQFWHGHRRYSTNGAYSGGWTFRNIDSEGGGGFLTTLDAQYSIDDVLVENCTARAVLSFVTIGLDSYTPAESGLNNDNHSHRGNSKFHTNFRIIGNRATFPTVHHFYGNPNHQSGNGPWERESNLKRWVPAMENPLAAEGKTPYPNDGSADKYKTYSGVNGGVTAGAAKYRCGIFAERTKHLHVSKNTFTGFYCGVVLSKPLRVESDSTSVYNVVRYCDGIISENTVMNTSSHGIYVISGASRSNIHIINNQVHQPGIPQAAYGDGWPVIWDWEAWGIKIAAQGVQCTGNIINNTWRTANQLHSGMLQSDIDNGNVYRMSDASGLVLDAYDRTYLLAGGICVWSPAQLDESGYTSYYAESSHNADDDTLIADNNIALSGRALTGILSSSMAVRLKVKGNSVKLTHITRAKLLANDYISFTVSLTADLAAAGAQPWGFYGGKGLQKLVLKDNIFDFSVSVGDGANQAIISDNIIEDVMTGRDKVAILRAAGNGITISGNKVNRGIIYVGSGGNSFIHGAKVQNNDLVPFGMTGGTTDWAVLGGQGIRIDGFGSALIVSENTTGGGHITLMGAGRYHGSIVSKNLTGWSTWEYNWGLADQTGTAAVFPNAGPGGDIIVHSGRDVLVDGNNTFGGGIYLDSEYAETGYYANKCTVSNNRTLGGSIDVYGEDHLIAQNDLRSPWKRGAVNHAFSKRSQITNQGVGCIRVYEARGSRIVGNLTDGRVDVTNAQRCEILSNRCWGGILVRSGSHVRVIDNDLQMSERGATYFDWDEPIVSGNILVTGCPSATISGNRMHARSRAAFNAQRWGKTHCGAGATVVDKSGIVPRRGDQSLIGMVVAPHDPHRNGGMLTNEGKLGLMKDLVKWVSGETSDPKSDWKYDLTSSTTHAGGYILLTDCLNFKVENNRASRIRMSGNCSWGDITNNEFTWGGAYPALTGNEGIRVDRGDTESLRIMSNRVWGSILLGRRSDGPNARRRAKRYVVTGNTVGTPMRGDYFVPKDMVFEEGPQWHEDGELNPWMHSAEGEGRPWRGGGGVIALEECGGCFVDGNVLHTDKHGTVAYIPELVANRYGSRPFGCVVYNAGENPVVHSFEDDAGQARFQVEVQNTARSIGHNPGTSEHTFGQTPVTNPLVDAEIEFPVTYDAAWPQFAHSFTAIDEWNTQNAEGKMPNSIVVHPPQSAAPENYALTGEVNAGKGRPWHPDHDQSSGGDTGVITGIGFVDDVLTFFGNITTGLSSMFGKIWPF